MVADGVFSMTTPAPPLTLPNQFDCIVDVGVVAMRLAADSADARLRMMSVATTLTLPGVTVRVTSSASEN